jgi:hypothetical protein
MRIETNDDQYTTPTVTVEEALEGFCNGDWSLYDAMFAKEIYDEMLDCQTWSQWPVSLPFSVRDISRTLEEIRPRRWEHIK